MLDGRNRVLNNDSVINCRPAVFLQILPRSYTRALQHDANRLVNAVWMVRKFARCLLEDRNSRGRPGINVNGHALRHPAILNVLSQFGPVCVASGLARERGSSRPRSRWNGPALFFRHSVLYLPREMRLPLLLLAVLLVLPCAFAAIPGIGRSFESFQELRTTAPNATGEVVYLVSWIAGNFKGGGQFVGTLSSGTDDGGTVASNGGSYRWNRIVDDYETLNVCHFGAVHDGIADDHDAVLRMLTWSNRQTNSLARNGARFVEGIIKISPMDLTGAERAEFALFGPTSPSARGPSTTIISDGSSAPVFNVSTRRLTIRGIKWDGQATAVVGADYVPTQISNVQPFFQNIETAGEFINVRSFYATRTGGFVFDVLDTIDTKFEDIETYNTFSNFWNIQWSNDPQGAWDHSTAVEATNMYISHSYGSSMLTAPRMGQGLLRNIVIKHCLGPGDFENSQWVSDNVYIEDCKLPFNYLSNRDLTHNIELVNASIQRGPSPNQWLSAYDQGFIQSNNYGMTVRGPFAQLWKSSFLRGTNNVSTPLWVKVGKFKNAIDGGIWKIRVVSRTEYRDANFTRPTANGAGGVTNILLQVSEESPVVTYSSQGQAAVTGVKYSDATADSVVLWVQISPFCGEYAFFTRGTGRYRTYSTDPDPSLFFVDGYTQLTDPVSNSTLDASRKASLHNGLAGWGAERRIVSVDTTVNVTLVPGAIAGYTIKKLNGKNIALPYYHVDPVITASPRLTTTATAGTAFSLSVTARFAVSYQWQRGSASSNFTNISGATASTYAVTASSTSDSGQYRVLCYGSEGRNKVATSRSVTVTIS